jgi:hydrogenase expression/formation protein HypE
MDAVQNRINISHGSGGRDTWDIINNLILKKIPESFKKVMDGVGLDVLDDAAAIKVGNEYVVISIDSHTVNPIKFPGGDLGKLAVSGTINDILMMGAKPLAIMDAIIVEEGVELELVNEVVNSLIKTAIEEGVAIIGGDFKVMPRGSIDKIVVITSGIGIGSNLIVDNKLAPGDKIIVTGPIADHGATIMAAQLGMLNKLEGLTSDVKPLTKIMLPLIERFQDKIHAARDPTRGGLASTLNEWASSTGHTILIRRSDIPIRSQTKGFLDMLGIDPLQVASEGIAVLAVDPDIADQMVNRLRELGEENAKIIGEVIETSDDFLRGKVIAETEVGGFVMVDNVSTPTPRIC